MKVVIIGSGNVATVMGGRIREAGHPVLQVMARRSAPAERLAAEWNCGYTTQWEQINPEADVYIVAVSDRALEEIGKVLRLPGRLVVHTAGAVPGSVLQAVSDRFGVLYPLQSLRSEVRPFPEFPLLVSADSPDDLVLIEDFARSLVSRVERVGDNDRLKLHAAAIFVNNFSNFLYTQTTLFCRQEGIDFSLLLPLIRETAERLERYAPADVQTGPAIRGDETTIRRHLEMLNNYKDLSELYRVFTKQIELFYRPGENSAG